VRQVTGHSGSTCGRLRPYPWGDWRGQLALHRKPEKPAYHGVQTPAERLPSQRRCPNNVSVQRADAAACACCCCRLPGDVAVPWRRQVHYIIHAAAKNRSWQPTPCVGGEMQPAACRQASSVASCCLKTFGVARDRSVRASYRSGCT
jgi:hypothetical protein